MFYVKKITALLTVLLAILLSPSTYAQSFTTASDANGADWYWNSTSLTLMLSDSSSFDSISLPDGAKIVIPSGKTLTVDASGNTNTVAINCTGALTIEGGGKLAVTAIDASGLSVQKLTASDIEFAVNVSRSSILNKHHTNPVNGIFANGNGTDAFVILKGCSGSIDGDFRGIDVNGADAIVDIKECRNLTVKGFTSDSTSTNFPYSGIRVVSNVIGSNTAEINIEDCVNMTVTGGTAIAMDAVVSASDNPKVNTPTSLNIKNSSVQINGFTSYYAAVFVNNYSKNSAGDGGGSVNVVGSDVTINAPNALGIMTSIQGDNTQTNIQFKDSQVNIIGSQGVKASNNGTSGNAGIDFDSCIIRMELTSENALIVDTNESDPHSIPDENKKGLLLLKTPTQNTVTLNNNVIIEQDFEFPAGAEFINTGDYTLLVKKGVTLTIDGEEYYFYADGCVIITPDNAVQVVIGDYDSESPTPTNIPKTGDNSHLVQWLCLMIVCTILFAATVRRKANGQFH